MSLGSDNGTPVLRIWKYADAPAELRRYLPHLGTHAWIAHVPAELMEQALLDLLRFKSDPAEPVQSVRLPDGNFVCVGLMPIAVNDANPAVAAAAKPSNTQSEEVTEPHS